MSDDTAVRWYSGRGSEAHAYTALRRDRYRARACDLLHTVDERLLIERPASNDVKRCGDCVVIAAAVEARGPWEVERDGLLLNVREMGDALDAARAEVESLRVRLEAREANFATARKCLRDAAEERDYWKKSSRDWCERTEEESRALDTARAEVADLRARNDELVVLVDRQAWLLEGRGEGEG